MGRKIKRSKKTLNDIMFEIYRDMYKNSEPSADFDFLVKTAEISDDGKKIIPYDKYFIEKSMYDKIIEEHILLNGLNENEKKAIIINSALGCSPMFKKI